MPIARVLRQHLELAIGRRATGLVFGRTSDQPFAPRTLNRRAGRAWKTAGLRPIGFHECRHTFASLMIAAGVNAKALQTFMGHASITVTLDLYGHLMPGAEAEAAGLLNAYLGRFDGARGEIFGPSEPFGPVSSGRWRPIRNRLDGSANGLICRVFRAL